jgi:methionine-rich copper-binding protein CopC
MNTKIAFALLLSLAALPALAHPRLTAAGPIPGSVVKAAPKNIRIQFSEAIEQAFSGLTLKNAKGEAQGVGTPALNAEKKVMTVPVTGDLLPGKYTVEWHALGDDTHPQKGKYVFELKP